MSSALLCNGSHAVDPPRRSYSLETRYDKEGMLGLHSLLSKEPHSSPKQYHAPAPMRGALLCNGSHALDPPRKSHSLETRLDRGHAQLPLPRIYTLRTTDDMRRTSGRVGGRAHRRTSAPSGRATGRTGRRTGGRADGGGQWTDGRTGADGRTSGWGRTMGGRADGGGRADDGFPKVKLRI